MNKIDKIISIVRQLREEGAVGGMTTGSSGPIAGFSALSPAGGPLQEQLIKWVRFKRDMLKVELVPVEIGYEKKILHNNQSNVLSLSNNRNKGCNP